MFTSDQMMFQCPPRPLPMERKWKSLVEIAPNCPRCASSNTKFCYYNNYSLSQPRYFCKGCRRYWTKGGSLRNVPVGGGCRKTRRANKSVKLSQNDSLVSFNYSKNLISSSDPMVQANQTNNNGSDIDLAVVFAKFLNQDSSFDQCNNEANELVSLTNSLTSDSEQNDDHQKMPDLIQESDDFLASLQLPPVVLGGEEQQNQERIQELIENQEMDAFGLQSFIGDQEMVQDDLWCQEAANLSNVVTWETSLVQQQPPQDFDSFLVDDQIKIPAAANFMSDINSWSSFDPSGFEVFSRP